MNAKANARARAKGPARKKAGAKPEANGAAAPADEGDRPAPVLSVAELPRETIPWLVPGLIPFGSVTVLEGRKDAGKSALCCALAAAVTGGPPLPGCRRKPPRACIWFAGEEHVPSTTSEKLEAAGADLRRVVCPGWDVRGRHAEHWLFPGDVERLDRLIADLGAALVVLDTMESFCAPGLSLYIPPQARQFMEPLAAVAGPRNCAVVGIRHMRKDCSGHSQDQGLGSAAVAAVARSVIRLDVLAEPRGLRALWRVAGNLCEPPRPLTAVIEAAGKAVKLSWQGSIEADDERLDAAGYDPVEADTLADAKRYVQDRLKEGKMPARDMIKDGKDLGFSTDKLFRARKALGARSVAKGGRGNRVWYWIL